MICLYGRTMATSPCSLQIIRSLLSSAAGNGGNLEFEIRLQEEHSSHASSPARCRQFNAFASSRANNFLPTPSSPVNSSEPPMRPLDNKRRSVSLTFSLPIRFENI